MERLTAVPARKIFVNPLTISLTPASTNSLVKPTKTATAAKFRGSAASVPVATVLSMLYPGNLSQVFEGENKIVQTMPVSPVTLFDFFV